MRFFADVLGMRIVVKVRGFIQLEAPNGDRVEVFGPDSEEQRHLTTGPVAGFLVDDASEAREEMVRIGVAGVTDLETGPDGHRWFYFSAPDNRIYEIGEAKRPRPPKGEKPKS